MAEDRKIQALPKALSLKLFRVKSIKHKKNDIKAGKILKFQVQEYARSVSRK
jgi:hypothetical protein